MAIQLFGILFSFLLFTPGGAATAQVPATYTIKLTITRDGGTIAAPTLKVRSGKTASMKMTGDKPYTIAASARPGAADPQHQVKVSVRFAPEQARPIDFNVVAKLNQPTAMTFKNDKGLTKVNVRVSTP